MHQQPAAAACGADESSLLDAWLAGSDDLVFAVDATLRLTRASASLARTTGRTLAELVGRSPIDAALFGAEAPRLQAHLAAGMASAKSAPSAPLELDWHDGEGTGRSYRIDLVVRRDGGGRATHLLVSARDISEQRQVEAHLRRREYEFRTLAENSPDAIIRYGHDLRATYANREIEERVTVSAARIVGRTPAEAAPPGMEGVQAYEAQLRRTLATGESGTVELLVPHPSGEMRVHSVVFAAERAPDGSIRGAMVVGRDVTEEVRIRQAVAEKEREFRTLAENSPDVILRYGLDARVVYCNPKITEVSGVPTPDIIGRRAKNALPVECIGAEPYLEQLERTLRAGEAGAVELQSFHANGVWRAYTVAFSAERDEHGVITGALAVAREITEQVRAARALQAKEREFRTLAENAIDNIARWDTDARMTYFNPVMARVFGSELERSLGLTPTEINPHYAPVQEAVLRVMREGRPETLELRFPGPDGVGQAVHEIRLVPERDEAGAVCSVLGIGRDVTEKIVQLEMIESLVRTDSLTRLANRQALHERGPTMLDVARRRSQMVGVMLLDLDHFKSVNDGLGHSAGDELLREIASRLGSCIRSNDLLVRLGGDEFVIVVPDFDDPAVLGVVAGKLHRALAAPLQIGLRDLHVTASVGVAVFPCDGDSIEQLLSHADSAMYHAKRGGRARTEYYRRELSETIQRRLLLEATMREACQGAGLEVYYQPQVCMRSAGLLLGAEALLRWRHPELGLLAPDAFIGLAEETGMIVPIGRWVLRSAAQAAVRWNRGRDTPLHIAVNVATRQFIDDDLPATLRQVLQDTGCEPRWLSVEITESALLQDSDLVQHALHALRDLGVRIALDDFGTGYSALNYLARFPVDCLKIDKSFVQAIGHSERENELVKAFIAMAGALKLGLVAEGVETDAQAAFLVAHGCATGQGYRFGRPIAEDRFEQLLRHGAPA
jgi:diguanylate cyclase (GGDEF)-like protein/PAS domain S-box-containing protein